MGVIMHSNIQYGGGSTIEPNPQESATEQLETLGIDGDVYEVTDANAAREVQATITEAQSRTNLADGDSVPTIFGKIKKWFSDLKTVAFSGSYNDLTNKPTIPAAQVNSDWDASSGVAAILHKPALATVATSGSYNDLSNKPTIPTVNNGTLTIQKNGTNVQTFSANQSGNATANIECATPSDVEGSKVATGNPLTITDAAGIKAEKIVIEFEPKQAGSGTPSPSNIRPITGYTSISADDWGKNFLKLNGEEDSLNNITLTPVKDSSGNVIKMHVQGTATANVNRGIGKLVSNLNRRIKFVIDSVPSGISRFYLWDNTTGTMAKDNIVNGTEHTISNDHSYSFAITVPNGNSVNGDIQAMAVNADETDLSFVPYKSITIQLGQTLYGGKLTILQDGSADVYCDTGYFDNDPNDYEYNSTAKVFVIKKSIQNVTVVNQVAQDAISNAFTFYPATTVYSQNDITGICFDQSNNCYFRIQGYTTQSEYTTFLTNNPMQVAYKLATPFTLHLSPVETLNLLQGINNVWTDGTTLSLTYQPDNAIGQAKGTSQELVDSASTWKLFAESANANIALPTNCKELYICVIYVTGNTSAIMYDFHILPDILTKATSYFRQGDYYTPDYFSRCEIRIRKTSNVYDTRVECLYMNNTTDRAANTKVKVYYR